MSFASDTIRKEWVKQLYSTSHDQGIKYLRTNEEGVRYYSVFGLYCNILIQNNIGSWHPVRFGTDTIYRFCVHDEQFTFFLSQPVLELAGLDISQAIYLTQLNDHGWSFQELAKEIESGFPNFNRPMSFLYNVHTLQNCCIPNS